MCHYISFFYQLKNQKRKNIFIYFDICSAALLPQASATRPDPTLKEDRGQRTEEALFLLKLLNHCALRLTLSRNTIRTKRLELLRVTPTSA